MRVAQNRRAGFYDGDNYGSDSDDLYLRRGLQSVAAYSERMLYWLRQPQLPAGFRQQQRHNAITPPTTEQTE